MAARKRILYQSIAVFADRSPASGCQCETTGGLPLTAPTGNWVNRIKQLSRVSSVDHSFNLTRTNVQQFGQLAALSREIIEAPTVSANVSYYLTDGSNEKRVGLVINNGVDSASWVSAFSGILTRTTDERNYYILITPEGEDAIGNVGVTDNVVAGIGNAFLSNYTANAQVGGMPTASITLEGLNFVWDSSSSGNYTPFVTPSDGTKNTTIKYCLPTAISGEVGEATALRPGDIIMTLDNLMGPELNGAGMACIQSFSLSLPVSREPQQCLGSRFASSREITFPVTATMNISCLVSEIEAGNLADKLCDSTNFTLNVTMNDPACSGAKTPALVFEMRNAKLDSQSVRYAIGGGATSDMVFSTQISSSEDQVNGIFISGKFSSQW